MSTAEETNQVPGMAGVIRPAIIHGVLWIVAWGLMVLFVPRLETFFGDLFREVPPVALLVFVLSEISVRYWFFVLPFFFLLTVAEGAVLYILCLLPRTDVLRKGWICVMLSAPVGVIAFTLLATLLAVLC